MPDSTPIFPVRDMDEAIQFYEIAGFDTRRYEGGGFAFVEYDGESVFDLDESEYAGDTHAGCYLLVPNVDAWHVDLIGKALPVGPVEDMPWGMREFRLTDPSGNYVRIGRSLTI